MPYRKENDSYISVQINTSYHIAQAAASSLKQALYNPEDSEDWQKLFPNAQHLEPAIIASQLYYIRPAGGYNTKWERDKHFKDFTDTLSYEDLTNTLKSEERGYIRNLLLSLQNRLAAIIEPSLSSQSHWHTEAGRKLSLEYLHNILMACFHDFRASPFIPSYDLDEAEEKTDQNEEIAPFVNNAALRWQAPAEMMQVFTTDPFTECQIYTNEPPYDDPQLKKLKDYANISEKLQRELLKGSHSIAQLCWPAHIAKNLGYAYENILVECFGDTDKSGEINEENARSLYDLWQNNATYDQNDEAEKPEEPSFDDNLKKYSTAWGGSIPRGCLDFLFVFPKVVKSLSEGNSLDRSIHIKYVQSLANTFTKLNIKSTSIAEGYKKIQLKGNSFHYRKARLEYSREFLSETGDDVTSNKIDALTASKKHQSKKSWRKQDVITTESLDEYRNLRTIASGSDIELRTSAVKNLDLNDAIILDPEQSRHWKSNLETNFLLLNAKGDNYEEKLKGVVKSARVSARIKSLALLLDTYNMAIIISELKNEAETEEEKEALMLQLAGQVAGTLANAYELAQDINHLAIATEKSTQYTRLLVGAQHKGWQLSKYTVGTKYLPLIGAVIGLTISTGDFMNAWEKGDDIKWVHLISGLGAIAGILGTITSLSCFGPIGLAIAVIGFAASYFYFRKDNPLLEWLRHGPFSCEIEDFIDVTEYTRIWNPEHMVQQSGMLPAELLKLSNQKNESGEPKMPPLLGLRIVQDGTVFVFDQNYKLIGLDQQGFHSSNEHMAQLKGDTVYLYDQPIAKLNKAFANSAVEITHRIIEMYEKAGIPNVEIDTSMRLNPDAAIGDNEDFFELYKTHPEAGAEALISASFPIKINLDMFPATGFVDTRHRDHNATGNNIKITVDVPYFIEGQSKLIIELRESRMPWESRYEKQVIPFTENGGYRLELSTLMFPEYEKGKHSKIVSDRVKCDIYRHVEKGVPQVIIIANIKPNDPENGVYEFNQPVLRAEAWARLSVNGHGEDDADLMVDGRALKSVFIPFRGRQGWLDCIGKYENIKTGVFTEKALDKPSHDEYASEDEAWISEKGSDKVRI